MPAVWTPVAWQSTWSLCITEMIAILSPSGVVVGELPAPFMRVKARQERMKANRMAACAVCTGAPDFGALQLQRAECGMS